MDLIKIEKSEGGKSVVNARDLHGFLEIKSDFRNWIKNHIIDFDFQENVDFVSTAVKVYRGHRIDYAITIDMAKELSMLSRSDKGKQARMYFIQCEKNLQKQTLTLPNFNDPIAAARAWADSKERELLAINEKNEAEAKVLEMKPKAIFAESIENTEDLILIRELAHQIGTIGQNNLYKWMRENKYVCKGSTEPTQKSINLGVLKVIERSRTTPKGVKIERTTKVTGKGQIYFTNKLKEI